MTKKYRYRKTSGSSLGSKRIKILACEQCTYTSAYKAGQELRTGSECPRCSTPTLRVFDSKREFEVFRTLKVTEPKSTVIECQVRKDLHAVSPDGEKVKLYAYILDFVVRPKNGEIRYIDVKGVSGEGKSKRFIATDVAIMKIKHFEAEYGVEVEIIG